MNKFVIDKKGLKISLIKGLNNIVNQINKQSVIRIGSFFIALTMIGSAATACSSSNGNNISNETKMSANNTDEDETTIDPTIIETKETIEEISNEILDVNIDDYKTMITPSFDTPDTNDSYTIDDISIIGNQYYTDLSNSDEYILTSPKNVELITKGVEYSKSESEFTNALLEIGGQVSNCSLDKSNYATVDGITNETFIVYDTNSIDNPDLDSNSKILTTDGARVEYKTISEEDFKKIDSEDYQKGFISIGPNDIILENVRIVTNIEGTDDMIIAGKNSEYGLCLFKTSKYNVVLEKVIEDSTIKPEVEGTTIDFTGEAYINYKFCYDVTALYHSINSVTITKDGMFYCYGKNYINTTVLTIIPSNLCSIETDANTKILPEQVEEELYTLPALSFIRGTYIQGPCNMFSNTLKEIEKETYICGASYYTGGDYDTISLMDKVKNFSMYDLDSCAIDTLVEPTVVPNSINPINIIIKTPTGSYSITQLKLDWGEIITQGIILSNVGNKETYMAKATFNYSNGDETLYDYVSVPIDNGIVKGSEVDIQKILKKN